MADDRDVARELIAAGRLRAGVVAAPAATPFFVTTDPAGRPRGVTVDLATELAQKLGVAVEFLVAPNSGEVVEALSSGRLDVAYMPIDEERRKSLDFGPAYYVARSTYLVHGDADIRTLADVDRPHIRVVGIAGTTTIRSAQRTLKNTAVAAARSIDEAMEMMRAKQADAFALSHDSLRLLAEQLPGSRILDGAFQTTGIAIAVPKNRPAALAYVRAFMEEAKASGSVRGALDRAGLAHEAMAPREGR